MKRRDFLTAAAASVASVGLFGQQALGQQEMGGGGHGQEFRNPLHDAKQRCG